MNLMLTQVKIGRKEILQSVNLKIKTGQTYAILGKNGSGKSTLLNSITNHPDTVYKGTVKLENPVFMGFQKPIEVPEIKTIDLLTHLHFLSSNKKVTADEFYTQYKSILEELQLSSNMLERPLNVQVSGGENKRIEMLQMAVIQPKTLLLDEIDTGLDLDAQIMIGNFISQYIKKHKPATIVVTHNMGFLKYFNVTKAIVLSEGKIVAEGTSALIKQIEEKGFASIHK